MFTNTELAVDTFNMLKSYGTATNQCIAVAASTHRNACITPEIPLCDGPGTIVGIVDNSRNSNGYSQNLFSY